MMSWCVGNKRRGKGRGNCQRLIPRSWGRSEGWGGMWGWMDGVYTFISNMQTTPTNLCYFVFKYIFIQILTFLNPYTHRSEWQPLLQPNMHRRHLPDPPLPLHFHHRGHRIRLHILHHIRILLHNRQCHPNGLLNARLHSMNYENFTRF